MPPGARGPLPPRGRLLEIIGRERERDSVTTRLRDNSGRDERSTGRDERGTVERERMRCPKA